jgi:molybdate transport system ATP-binding protein
MSAESVISARFAGTLGAFGIDVAIDAPMQGVTALFGPSGAGKTSVLDMVAGLLRPDQGRIAVGGEVLFDSAAGIDLAPEQRRCGYVFQDLRLFPHRRVRDNLLFGWRLTPPAQRWLTLDEVTDFLGIAPLLDRMPATLSGGEAQRVAIGRALLAGPRVLLLDEPLTALDRPRRDGLLSVIEGIRDRFALPILYVSHDAGEIARLAATVVQIGD